MKYCYDSAAAFSRSVKMLTENPESVAWGLMSKWCIENIGDRTGRRYVGVAPIGHHPNGAPHQNVSEQETHPYVAMMFLVGDECEKKSFYGLDVEDVPDGLKMWVPILKK